MRGICARPLIGAVTSRRFSASPFILLACIILFAGTFSGCASASADRSATTKLSVVPSVIDFKAVVVGQKNSQTVQITNSSSNSINLSSLQVSGTGFSLRSAKAPVLLAPGSHVSLSVVFAPPAAADATGSLVISTSDFDTPVRVPLSGAGEKAAAKLTLSPASVNFGTRAVRTSTSQSVVLTNTGNSSLSISSISIANPAFSVAGISKGVSLSPNQKLEFQVWYHPTVAGRAAVTISLDSSASLAPVTLPVVGSASNTAVPTPGTTAAHSVTLNWNNGSTSTVGYHIYRAEVSGGPFERLNQGLLETTSYKDTDVVSGGHYFYVVTAVAEGSPESAYSNEVAVDVPSN
jgi:Abnormal spindle-like microcephaly-assoc'd, ASPM-SPD-2-Hydin/Transmembrane protein 131-like N-terminal